MSLAMRLARSAGVVLLSIFICFCFAQTIFNLLLLYKPACPEGQSCSVIFAGPAEYFLMQFQIALSCGLVLSGPFLVGEAYSLAASQLSRRARNLADPYLVTAPVVFLSGALAAYFILTPALLRVGAMPATADGYLGFILRVPPAFGILFQIPLLGALLGELGAASSKLLAKMRLGAVIGAAFVALIIAPTDRGSQIILAVTSLLLYELAICVVRLIEKRRDPRS